MFENLTDTELHTMELRCFDLLMHQHGLKLANAQVMTTYLRAEIDRRASSRKTEIKHQGLSRRDEPRHRGIHLAASRTHL
jgi:hypothetical protein